MKPHVLATLVLAALAPAAHADPEPDPARPGDQQYLEGKRHYDLQEWDEAIARFKEAYRLRADPASLFNIAQAYRLKGDCQNAIATYKAYARNFPTADNLPKVEKFIADLEATCPKEAAPPVVTPPPATTAPATTTPPAPARQPPPPPIDRDPGRTKRIVGYALGGAGVVALGVATGFGIAAHGKAHDVTTGAGPWDPSLQTAGLRDQRDARIFLGVGAALVITGGMFAYLGFTAKPETIAVAPRSDGGAQLVWSGRF